jgi:hypothetical protein
MSVLRKTTEPPQTAESGASDNNLPHFDARPETTFRTEDNESTGLTAKLGTTPNVTERGWEELLRKTAAWLAIIATGSYACGILALMLWQAAHGYWSDAEIRHMPAVIGLPSAAGAALSLVLLLRAVSGNIEIKILGLEFKGAAAPIIMWILCFLAITLAIKETWDLKY